MVRSTITKQFMTGICLGIVVYYLFVPSLHDIRMRAHHDKAHVRSGKVENFEKEKELPKDLDDVELENMQFKDLNEDRGHHHDNTKIADSLKKQITVFCVILAKTVDLPKKSTAIHKTWAKRCTQVVFLAHGAIDSYNFPIVEVGSPEQFSFYRKKIQSVISLIMKEYIEQCDWFLIATDETYVIMENLRHFLSTKDPTSPVLYGRVNPFKGVEFKKIGLPWQFNIKNMGFVMSKEAVRRVSAIDYKQISCDGPVSGDAYEDLCMDVAGVIVGSTKDTDGREMFNCVPPEHLSLIYFHEHEEVGATGKVTVSDYAISFCMVNAPKQFGLEYHTYHLRAYGVDKLHV
ncbi:glycoprotein-N-acetylgalactosamine 3-beta-galactosyltransferase 1-like [Mizuhopecten yessoensis]|uniref:Glycoprotein-N-acetylgalactosamine 3-beta-galactosyltransferase 1 n=1 Tax=Mizuhopecten yessoensis TaxID=6573 RepID=A0A210Q9I0_MIZYE|nr:glycoprotein-N-acetylgalactosamine 3-beta-galactosyltransferase 1-like [Mizuhopecten yessoensis]OWF45402.1 Glycoprotein-N-acetylgalactosamine 3-beta-galactosyltransferase 1 [Mizuhopecten yessoensis]